MTELICAYNNQYPSWWTEDWIKSMENLYAGLKISQINVAVDPKICSEYKGLPTNLRDFPAYLLYNQDSSNTPLNVLQGGIQRQNVENFLEDAHFYL